MMSSGATGSRYNPIAGAAAFAPIVGAFGALSVTAIVVVFTVPANRTPHASALNILATGLLVLGMFGSLIGALGLAGLGAETKVTASIGAAVMLVAIPAALSLIGTLGAFEVLSVLYEPGAAPLFIFIVAVGAVFGVIHAALAVSDSVTALIPEDPNTHAAWLERQWIKDERAGRRWAFRAGAAGIAPVIIGLVVRSFGSSVRPTVTETNWIVGTGILLTLIGQLASLRRATHDQDKDDVGPRPTEAFATTATIGLYSMVLLLFLP